MSRDGDAVAPPEELEGLTAEWMTAAARCRAPGVEVTSLHFGPTRQGSNTTARLLLGYNRAGHEARLPATMYAKGAWTGRGVGGTFNEARFDQHIAPQLPGVDLPHCWFASADNESRQAVIVMEDLLARNVILGSASRASRPIRRSSSPTSSRSSTRSGSRAPSSTARTGCTARHRRRLRRASQPTTRPGSSGPSRTGGGRSAWPTATPTSFPSTSRTVCS